MRQNVVLRERNRSARSFVRNRCKRVILALQSGQFEEVDQSFKEAVRALDKAAAQKIIHKNAAARKKSRLSQRIKKAKANQSAPAEA